MYNIGVYLKVNKLRAGFEKKNVSGNKITCQNYNI